MTIILIELRKKNDFCFNVKRILKSFFKIKVYFLHFINIFIFTINDSFPSLYV